MKADLRVAATIAALAAVAVGAAGDWWTLRWSDALLGDGQTGVSGSTGTSGLAILLPAIVIAVVLLMLTLGRMGRRVVAGLASAVGVAMVALALGMRTPGESWVAQFVPVTLSPSAAQVTPSWPGVIYAILGGVVALTCAIMVVRPPRSRVRARPTDSGEMTDPLASWKAMDAGLDPTDEGERA